MQPIMFQGTGSNVGKSILVAGLCRCAKRRGISVAPFKPQNMSNNAAVTKDNGEIGRAQAFQAFASKIEPLSEMNPILLKPESNARTQIIINGKYYKTINSGDYLRVKKDLIHNVIQSYNSIKKKYELILVEGAGSPAEINLRENDIANMGFAEKAKLPVILIADIDRGGVIAQLVGTKAVLSESDNSLIKGFIVNKFRGDIKLFDKGYNYIMKETSWEGFGILPWFDHHKNFPAEDTQGIKEFKRPNKLKIVCLKLPKIANFDDLDPIAQETNISLEMLEKGDPIPGDSHLVIIPGSKSTIADLNFIKEQGWDVDLKSHLNRGKYVLGICGGFQMLGEYIDDNLGLEGSPTVSKGLDLLKVKTKMKPKKKVCKVNAKHLDTNTLFQGYEIHIGETFGLDCERPFALIDMKKDGAISENGLVIGTYLHGMFVNDEFRKKFLEKIGFSSSNSNYISSLDKTLNKLSDKIEENINVDKILETQL